MTFLTEPAIRQNPSFPINEKLKNHVPTFYVVSCVAHLQINATSGAKLTIKGEAFSSRSGAVWAEDAEGGMVSDKIAVNLRDSPSRVVPAGFAAIEDACWLP